MSISSRVKQVKELLAQKDDAERWEPPAACDRGSEVFSGENFVLWQLHNATNASRSQTTRVTCAHSEARLAF